MNAVCSLLIKHSLSLDLTLRLIFSMGQGQETSAFLSATPIVSPKMHEI